MCVWVEEDDFFGGFQVDVEIPVELSFGLDGFIIEACYDVFCWDVIEVAWGDGTNHVELIESVQRKC